MPRKQDSLSTRCAYLCLPFLYVIAHSRVICTVLQGGLILFCQEKATTGIVRGHRNKGSQGAIICASTPFISLACSYPGRCCPIAGDLCSAKSATIAWLNAGIVMLY